MVDDPGHDPFAGLLPFVRVAEERSFSRAAARLGVSVAAVSKAVARLESRLGVPLLTRTSRRVDLTPEGSAFLERGRRALDEVQAATESVVQSQRVAQGKVRVSLSPVLGRVVVPRLSSLASRHPKLSFELSVTDRVVALGAEGVDVAVRIGESADASLVGRTLARPRWVTVATPGYVGRRGTPRTVASLDQHDCLAFVTPRGVVRAWSFGGVKGRPVSYTPSSRLSIDSGELLVEAALAGLGIAQVFDFMAAEHLRVGRLVELLPASATDGPVIRALCLPGRRQSPKVRVTLDFLAFAFEDALRPKP